LRHLSVAVAESAGAAVGVGARAAQQGAAVVVGVRAAQQGVAVVVEARAAHRGAVVVVAESAGAVEAAVFQQGALEPDPVSCLRALMEQRDHVGTLSATRRPGHDGVAQKIPDHNADPVGAHANKDTHG